MAKKFVELPVVSSIVPASAVPTVIETLLTAEQLAAYLQVDPAYVFEKTRSRCPNPIPAIRLGARSLRFKMSDIQAWIDAQQGTLTEKRTYRLSPSAKRRRKERDAARQTQRETTARKAVAA